MFYLCTVKKTSGSSSVGRASAFQAECREFEPRLPLFDTYFCGSSSVGRASAFQAECREFEPRLPLCKKILDVIIKDFFYFIRTARLIVDMSCKLYCCRHELQTLFIVGTSCKLAPAGQIRASGEVLRRNKLRLYRGFTVIC